MTAEGAGPAGGGADDAGEAATEVACLEVPALPPYVGVARAVVRAVAAAQSGLDEGRLDDIRLAVSEVCTDAVARVGQRGSRGWVTLRCVRGPGRFEVRVETPPETTPTANGDVAAPAERVWSAELVRALVDDVEARDSYASHVVRLVVKLGE